MMHNLFNNNIKTEAEKATETPKNAQDQEIPKDSEIDQSKRQTFR
jgi:hypothetical protein